MEIIRFDLEELKKNAIKTAKEWPSWKESSEEFYKAIKKYAKQDSIDYSVLESKTKLFTDIYNKYEGKQSVVYITLKDRVKNKIKRVIKK